MYGNRARIGLIVPSSNTVCEPEMASLCPNGVATYAARVLFEPTLAGLEDMKTHVSRALAELTSEGISDLIAFCCTVGSILGGKDADQKLCEFMEKQAGRHSITTGTAVKAALQKLEVKILAVATPYTNDINEVEKQILESIGYEISSIKGIHQNIRPKNFRNDMIGRLAPEDAYKIAKEVNSKANDAVFISCTNFRSIEIIELLEKEIGKPVITSNQATIWHALRKIGIRDNLHGYGMLFEHF